MGSLGLSGRWLRAAAWSGRGTAPGPWGWLCSLAGGLATLATAPSRLTGVCNEQPYPGGVSGPGRGWGPSLPCSQRPLCSLLGTFHWLPVTSWMKSRLLSTADSLFRGAFSYGLCKAQQMFWASLAT